MSLKNYVSYEDFGAKGDGVTNDYRAIRAAHEYANEKGLPVLGSAGACYLIEEAGEPISVKTDVDFGGAKIIFDDTYVTSPSNNTDGLPRVLKSSVIFRIDNDHPYLHASEEQLRELNSVRDGDGFMIRGLEDGEPSTRINLRLGYPALLLIKNHNNMTYKRYGFAGNGAYQREIILVDADGHIDPETPLLHSYREVTEILIHRTDVAPISIKNALIETRASRIFHTVGQSIARCFSVERAHTTFEGIRHTVVGELPRFEPVRIGDDGLCHSVSDEGYTYSGGAIYDKDGKLYTGGDIKPFIGPGYYGFLHIDLAHDTLVRDCIFQSHILYVEGTYDITANMANKLVFEDCIQSNFFELDENGNETKLPSMDLHWGISGTNYCKNMDFIRSRLTRYDAHAGVVNGRVIDSEISVLRLIGGGNFLMQGTKIYARYNRPIQLREDYGASFNGTVTIKDCEIIDAWDTGETVKALIDAPASYWDMGYKTYFPDLVIDNIKFNKTVYPEIALIHSPKDTDPLWYAPTVNILTSGIEDPDTAQAFHYTALDTGSWIEENILAEGARFHGLKYEVYKNSRGSETVRIYDTHNRFPYTPPHFIEVKNNENNGYQLTLYNSSFFKDTEIIIEGESLVIK